MKDITVCLCHLFITGQASQRVTGYSIKKKKESLVIFFVNFLLQQGLFMGEGRMVGDGSRFIRITGGGGVDGKAICAVAAVE